MKIKQKNTAVILLHCEDQKDIVAAVTDFLHKNEGSIVSLDVHVDRDDDRFFMRAEWSLDNFIIPNDKIADYFETLLAKRFDMQWSLHFMDAVPKLAIFVSKYSHCLFDILSRYESGEWKVDIPLIISNHEKFSYIGERYNIPYYYIPITKENKVEQEAKEIALIEKYNIDLLVLARYMQVLTEDFTNHYTNKIINIHHSSLPAFPGSNPYRAAYNRGVKFMGATAHYVTPELDEGPIIHQDVVTISHTDSVADMKRKGRDIEKVVLAKAVRAHNKS